MEKPRETNMDGYFDTIGEDEVNGINKEIHRLVRIQHQYSLYLREAGIAAIMGNKGITMELAPEDQDTSRKVLSIRGSALLMETLFDKLIGG